MTQAQFAQWLGVSIKQVKYLEHQRRNPSGPTRRLLGILAQQLGFDGAAVVQVLGASQSQPKLPPRPSQPKKPQPANAGAKNNGALTVAAPKAEAANPEVVSDPPPSGDEAFVWL